MSRMFSFFAALAAAVVLMAGGAGAQEPYFEIEALNRGLGESPARVDRSTPRATIETLYRLAARDDWDTAAHVLDLSDMPPDVQPEIGPQLAAMLKTLIERKVVIDWSQLVDRPDGLDVSEPSRSATSGMTRRSFLLWEFNIDSVPADIRLNRVKPDDGDAVWVFSSRTVEDITPLYEEYGPSDLEEWLPDALRTDAIWDVMWWELIGLPLLAGIATAVGIGVRRGIRAINSRISSHLLSRITEASATPLIIAAITTVIWWGASTIFVFSGRLDALVSPIVAVGFVTALLMLILNTLEQVLDTLVGFEDIDLSSRQEAEKRDKATKVAAIRRVLVLATFLVGVGLVFASADIFQTLGFSILASAGAITLVLGFAARKVLGNIMASLQIALNHSARIGDRVVYKEHLCHVERINFTYVQLRDWDGTRLVVPVEEFVSETFENWTLNNPEMLRILKFKLEPSADLDALRSAFDDVIASLDPDEIDDAEKSQVVVTGQDIFGIDVWFYVPCADPNTSWDLACEAREKLIRRIVELEKSTGEQIFPEASAAEAA